MNHLIELIKKRKEIIKFLIAGGTATLTNFSLLYFFTDILGIWYLLSSVLAFIVAFFVSFFLQKFWTFNDGGRDDLYRQMAAYLVIALLGLSFNATSMYILVDNFKLWYMLAQFFTSGFIAIGNFLAYKTFVFNRRKMESYGK